jgi:putative two-component system response regulator
MEQIKHRVLAVDDEEGVREAVCEFLEIEGFEVEQAEDAETALSLLNEKRFDLVVTDMKLPGMDGIAFSKIIKEASPDTGIIVITAYGNIPSALEAMVFGAEDYILKPFSLEAIRHSVRKVFEKKRLVAENIAYQAELERKVRERSAEIEDAGTRLGQTFYKTIYIFGNALESREPYLHGRTERITILALQTARVLGWNQTSVSQLLFGAPVSDIGKLAIPEELLFKTDPLEPEEIRVIRSHVEEGVWIVADLAHFLDSAAIIHFHHERIDGSGYPLGLKGEAIPATARLVAICDSFDAMVHPRPWRKARSWQEALAELQSLAGTAYDAEMVKGFAAALEEHNLQRLIGRKPTELFYELTLPILASPEAWPA